MENSKQIVYSIDFDGTLAVTLVFGKGQENEQHE